MKKNVLFVTLLFLSLVQVSFSGTNKPNIIYFNADDLGVMDVGYNSSRYHTPNIDRLKVEGMVFTEAYAPAANCAPSRACVMSGQYGPRHGVYTVADSKRGKAKDRRIIPIENTLHLQPDNITIAAALQAGGYKTIHLGKWHVGKDPLKQGYDYNIGGDHSGGPSGGYFTPFKKGTMTEYNDQYPAGTHRVDIFADEANRFMEKHRSEPFFVHMAYYSVHTALEPVPEFVDKYKEKNVHATYASMIEKMDQGMGRILDKLEDLGLKDKTLVIFCSDNGGICSISSQKPYRAGKGSYFEGGIRVPLVIRWPQKVTANAMCDVPVMGIDFYPTMLEATGLTIPKGKILDGHSLLPLLTQSGSLPERNLFWHFPVYLQKYKGAADESHDPLFRTRPGSVVQQGKWKLHEYYEDGRLELYNLDRDINERHNLAQQMPEKAKELHQLLKQWREKMDAPVPTERNPKYQGN